jgi:hypothetical protein
VLLHTEISGVTRQVGDQCAAAAPGFAPNICPAGVGRYHFLHAQHAKHDRARARACGKRCRRCAFTDTVHSKACNGVWLAGDHPPEFGDIVGGRDLAPLGKPLVILQLRQDAFPRRMACVCLAVAVVRVGPVQALVRPCVRYPVEPASVEISNAATVTQYRLLSSGKACVGNKDNG